MQRTPGAAPVAGPSGAARGSTRPSISELRRQMAEKKRLKGQDKLDSTVFDPYEKAEYAKDLKRLPTLIYYNTSHMFAHFSPTDRNHPENPERLANIIDLCISSELFGKCVILQSNELATEDDVMLVHSEEAYTTLRRITIESCSNEDFQEHATRYDSVYFNDATFAAARAALKAAIRMVEHVARGDYMNGFAIVRPPGHHAMRDDFCGYCFFNNVACAVQNVLNLNLAKKVLILDLDVHHGQGTQQAFYDNNNVLYISVHRYEHGTFWPYLRDSQFDFIGIKEGKGFNVNIPVNDTGLTDTDYMTFIHHIVLPLASEFNPDIIVVSAGYDACIGCPEFDPDVIVMSAGYDSCMGDDKGEMDVSPLFYQHVIALLSSLAEGRIACILEGGYFPESLAEGVKYTIMGLMGERCPPLEPLQQPKPSVIETINNVKSVLMPYWHCFNKVATVSDVMEQNRYLYHTVSLKYFGTPLEPPYAVLGGYPVNTDERDQRCTHLLHSFTKVHENKNLPVVWTYDQSMLLHKAAREFPEKPDRLTAIKRQLEEFELIDRLLLVKNTHRVDYVRKWMEVVHDNKYLKKVLLNTPSLATERNDLFMSENTSNAIVSAVGGLLAVVEKVLSKKAASGIAVIRPPGHHADYAKPEGFCWVNNIAVAAKYAEIEHYLERILIVDFDVHHGNGTQNIFYDSKKVLYLSVHRFDNGKFYPSTLEGGVNYVGDGIGEGYNVNIPFDNDKMGDSEYLTAFHNIILPIAYQFAPQLVLISAGFDAAVHDPLGHYKVTPECFGHMVSLLRPLAQGRLILTLEGGYNTTSTAYAMALSAKAVLGDPLPRIEGLYKTVSPNCKKALQKVIDVHRYYWTALNVHKILPSQVEAAEEKGQLTYCDKSPEVNQSKSPSPDEEPRPGHSSM